METSYPIMEQSHGHYLQRSKNFWVKQTGDGNCFFISSAKNSHHFLNHTTTMRERTNGDREFRFYVDGVLIGKGLVAEGWR